ncbi:uncharacterized protein [Dendrobates tinctorius]|uniref:uncharacterized protein isoform X2 n=1 Tax=Dendrobates tinctorius TaxID=92724 RepID=UPI003CC9C814
MTSVLSLYRLLIKKCWRKDTGKDTTKADTENRADADDDAGDDAPHGLTATKTDVVKNTDNSSSGPGYIAIDIDPDEDVIVSSDEEQEDDNSNVSDDVPHGPMAEKRDVCTNTDNSSSGPDYVVIDIDPDENMIISTYRENWDEIIIGRNVENKDVLENNKISIFGPGYVIINKHPNEDVTISDREYLDKTNIEMRKMLMDPLPKTEMSSKTPTSPRLDPIM